MAATETSFMNPVGDAGSVAVNPLSTRFVRPGQIDYLFPAGKLVDRSALFRNLERHQALAIVGPHGTGKSTFLHWWLKDRTDVRWIGLSSGRLVGPDAPPTTAIIDQIKHHFSAWKRSWQLLRSLAKDRNAYWVVDGWEQLPRIIAIAIRWSLRRHSKRLIVTSHRDHVGILTIHRTAVDADVLFSMLDHLLDQAPQTQAARIRSAAQRRIEKSEITNVREFLFDLYDVAAQATTSQ
jgi:hypothetical protein